MSDATALRFAGDYGVCPWCDMPVAELVRLGEILYADPCGHPVVRLRYLAGEFAPFVKAQWQNQEGYPRPHFQEYLQKAEPVRYRYHKIEAPTTEQKASE